MIQFATGIVERIGFVNRGITVQDIPCTPFIIPTVIYIIMTYMIINFSTLVLYLIAYDIIYMPYNSHLKYII